ncbi:MAG: helix-turn-helix domain-containing protein [Spirochaetales bacterium]|nr:helix-turn-helix domain-containing protein [Spirochaetales bacterium]
MNKKNIPYDVFAARCPSRTVFEHIFSRWGALILARLSEGPARFGELTRGVDGISERMLSKSLKVLEEEGFVYRKEYDQKPPRVEYGLTESGSRISLSITTVINQLYNELEDRRS